MSMLRWKVGNVTVTRVVDDETSSFGGFLLPQATPEQVQRIAWLRPFLEDDGRLILSVHALVVESCGSRILVDTCLGNDKERLLPEWSMRSSSFLEDLAAADAPRESIMRVDGGWAPTFPNARYLFAREEWEHWKDQPEELGPVITDSVRPIVDAGLADLVETDHALTDEVSLEPTPGHTPGHVSVRIRSAGEEAVITGDMIHHPCQIAHPDWAAVVDWDAECGVRTRRGFLERSAGGAVLVIGTHFAAPTAGHIVRDGDAYRLDP
jgi:hypothetical protein